MQQDYGRRRRDERDGWEHDDREHDDREHARPRRRGLVSRVFSMLKLALFLAPVTLFAASYFVTDCGSRSGSGLGQVFRAGACARGEILGGALSLPDNLGLLRRAMN